MRMQLQIAVLLGIAATSGNSEFFAMAQWMGTRMAWNPKQDPWKLHREVNDKLNGAAADEM